MLFPAAIPILHGDTWHLPTCGALTDGGGAKVALCRSLPLSMAGVSRFEMTLF